MAKDLDASKLGKAGAALSALTMLVLGILGNLNIYMPAVNQMMKWHMFFDLSIVGIITGMIEAAIIGYILLYAFGWFYNKF